MIYLMHVPPTPEKARRSSALANLKQGFAYVWSTPAVLALMILAYVPRIFAVPYQTLMPVFQKDVLGVGPEGLGLLMAAPGVGAVLSVLVLASLTNRVKQRSLIGGKHYHPWCFSHSFFSDYLLLACARGFSCGGWFPDAVLGQHEYHAHAHRSR